MRLMVGLAAFVTVACTGLAPLPGDPVPDVRAAIAKKDFTAASEILENYRTERGSTVELVDGLSVLAQGLKASGDEGRASEVARDTYIVASKLMLARRVDDEPRLPIALGRAIEIMAQAQVSRGATRPALHFLRGELVSYRGTSLEKRIQRNINLIELEGTPAPPLDLSEHLGAAPPTLDSLKGRVVLLFFWAHYCADCKAEAPILARIADKYRADGLSLVAPTQRYGYVAEGREADPATETRYIEEIRRTFYPALTDVPIPLSEVNHRRYGVSSTPTIVLLDREGRVALYHPGTMTEEELDVRIRRLLAARAQTS
jgi:thiol-disulfide isomerase/thioredoxin